jgi:hypothetical protein
VKDSGGKVYAEGSLPATRFDLDPWDENAAPTVERSDGSDPVHRSDLRLIEAACRRAKGSASADAAGHRGFEKEE